MDHRLQWDSLTEQHQPVLSTMMPQHPVKMMMAVMNPQGIYACTKRGFHIQTTPLSGNAAAVACAAADADAVGGRSSCGAGSRTDCTR